jgi:hypothetical protein
MGFDIAASSPRVAPQRRTEPPVEGALCLICHGSETTKSVTGAAPPTSAQHLHFEGYLRGIAMRVALRAAARTLDPRTLTMTAAFVCRGNKRTPLLWNLASFQTFLAKA